MARAVQLPTLQEPFPASFQALLPALLATRSHVDAGRVERLRARRAVLSQSGTFVGHRRYERGDDLRHLDWSAYARTGELFTKQLEDDDRRAVTIALDRQEKGQGEMSAIQELERQGLQVVSIIRLEHILEYLDDSGQLADREAIEAYRAQYGID